MEGKSLGILRCCPCSSEERCGWRRRRWYNASVPTSLQPPGSPESWVGVGYRSFRKHWAWVKYGSQGGQGDTEHSLQGPGLGESSWVPVRSGKINEDGLWTKKVCHQSSSARH